MEGAHIYSYEYWSDIIDELDHYHGLLPDQSPEFIEGLLEKKPRILSIGQVKWLQDLQKRYLA